MALNNQVLLAETHTPEYLLHKYWARKPHNIISMFIKELLPNGGVLLDPFCGSGVVLHEAQKQGIKSIGIDINPIAVLNSKVITSPPNSNEFIKTVTQILDDIETSCGTSFKTKIGDTVRYCVHSTTVQCPNCGKIIDSTIAKKIKTKSFCPACNSELSINLENMMGSKVIGYCVAGKKEILNDDEECSNQAHLSEEICFHNNCDKYDYQFVENRRILAFDGMHTSSLFTPRNFDILCELAERFNQIENEKIKNAALLLLTASVAQCSKLIPHRNNLSTGGPAWSVPGFWVPAQHLETNPLIHLRARLKKFDKGLRNLEKDSLATAKIITGDSKIELPKLKKKVDLVFLDPPYGDNVPYTEFSSMWNSFLCEQPNIDLDISVSDRNPRQFAWKKYRNDLKEIITQCSNKLSSGGHLLITFNNNDIKAWEALLGSLQECGFVCDYISYVIPAVVSSKAQFSPKGSYITDMYAVYSYKPQKKASKSMKCITDSLQKCALARKGCVAKNLVYRTIMIEWIENNIDSSLLENIPQIIDTLFRKDDEDNNLLIYKDFSDSDFDLSHDICKAVQKILDNGPINWKELYQLIASKYIDYGFLDANELREYLSDHIIISSQNVCIAYKE